MNKVYDDIGAQKDWNLGIVLELCISVNVVSFRLPLQI